MTIGARYWNESPPKIRRRRTQKRPFPPHRLRAGWRWREVGELAEVGDLCCDPRIAPVEIIKEYVVAPTTHPIMTKRKKRGRDRTK